ncbi:uncharacterized protein BP5553_09640 [Venustampulla echinocandica]|uniref:Pentacotripeptide-repeat region of PRORP domain-containing protein n=1 Tax=Venustampulla echinocandica TaxID=2656787 RepID=A0A370TBJ7_9HELO|nr:uncharacterized protein BP5553_09640 [Venustampulla echinocandica]RDL31431.1 hypothetical protein BP5553_09640 [Venustampulla echinocandica]
MPTTLPVPSKGALRTLRNLALGTSCTLAFGTGLLTEDRRRRLHTMREVHGNVQKIKSSRSYYGAGRALIDTLDDLGAGYAPESIFLAGDPAMRSLTKDTNRALKSEESISTRSPEPTALPPPFFPVPGHIERPPKDLWRRPPAIRSHLPITAPPPPPPGLSRAKIHNHQHRLASDVASILEGGGVETNVDAAALRFLDTFEEGLPIDGSGLLRPLVDVAAELSKACVKQSKLDYSERILDVVLKYPPIDEAQFQSLQPYSVVQHLVDGLKNEALSDSRAVDAKLRKACSIYMMEFDGKPHTAQESDLEIVQSLGERLCAESYRVGMYDLTIDIYSHLPRKRSCGVQTLSHVIAACHELGMHGKVFGYFSRYAQKLPDQVDFYHTVGRVIDSALKHGRGNMNRAEETLVIATRMAKSRGFSTSTTPILKVIGHQWRSTKNIHKTRELFDRLEPLAHVAGHPQAAYGAIIQFCIEAGEEAAATSYYEKLRESYEPLPGDVRIYGHFALAKAMRNDWSGVKEDLRNMAVLSPDHKHDFNSCFTPILKVFAKSHPVNETEDFVRGFVEEGHLEMTAFISNIMIDTYAKAREMASLVRWIEYATSVGCKMDAVSVNIILNNCYRTWKFPFEETYHLYRHILGLGKGSRNLTDNDTMEILGRIAVNDSPTAPERDRRLRLLKELGRPKHSWSSSGVHRAMKTTLANENPAATLKIYDRACTEDLLLGRGHLVAAVKASLQVNGDNVDESIRLIKDAQRGGQNVELPIAILIVHQMTKVCGQDQPAIHLQGMVQNTMSTLDKYGFNVSPPVLTHTISLLERHGRFRQAFNFWTTISQHQGLPPSSIDLVTLSALLRVFIGLRDARGICWVGKILVGNGLVPDTRLYTDVKKARKSAMDIEMQEPSLHISKFVAALSELRTTVACLRKRAASEKRDVRDMTVKIMERAIKNQENEKSQGQKAATIVHVAMEASPKPRGLSEPVKESLDLDKEPCYGFFVGPRKVVEVA